MCCFFFSSRRRHTRLQGDWSSDVCSSDLGEGTTADITEGLATRAGPQSYVLSRWLFLRLFGVVYFVAFISLTLQITGLVGSRGILPAGEFLQRGHAPHRHRAYRLVPTLPSTGASTGG